MVALPASSSRAGAGTDKTMGIKMLKGRQQWDKMMAANQKQIEFLEAGTLIERSEVYLVCQ
jgi:hypothetical protein